MLAHFVKTTLSLFTAISIASAANSLDVPLPTGDIVLTVTGDIEATNDDNKLVFDRETLAALGNEEFTTSTIWTEGPHSFVGVPLKVLTDLIGA